MDDVPKISVIMSVYNGETYLSQSIKSILNQTFENFEFIIIDDGSKDNSWEIIKAFSEKDARIRLFKNEKNVGIKGFIKNLNFGCKTAKAQYIARMDQDDISHNNRLKLQFEFLENNPDVFIVGSALKKIDHSNNNLGLMQAPLVDEEIKKVMPKKICLYHPVIMFRNEYYKDFYREKMLYCEDYDLYLRLITDCRKMANLKECLLEYRVLEDSMSRKEDKIIKNLFINQSKKFYKERISMSIDSYDFFDPNEFINIYTNPSKKLVKKAIAVSKKYFDYEGFKKMLDLYRTFSKDAFFFRNKILLSFGKTLFYQHSKVINKLRP